MAQLNNTIIGGSRWLTEWLTGFWRHVYLPWVETIQQPLSKEVLCCSAVMRRNLPGPMEAPVYPLVSLWPGCFFPVDSSHTAAQHTDIACPDLLVTSMFIPFRDWWAPHYRTTEGVLTPHTHPLLYGCLNACLWQISTWKEAHTCSLCKHMLVFHLLPLTLWVGPVWWELVGAIRVSHSVRQQL